MTLGLVKASDRKTTSGWCCRMSSIAHSQKGKGLVWGLSTRNSFTPCSTHSMIMSRSSIHSDGMAPGA